MRKNRVMIIILAVILAGIVCFFVIQKNKIQEIKIKNEKLKVEEKQKPAEIAKPKTEAPVIKKAEEKKIIEEVVNPIEEKSEAPIINEAEQSVKSEPDKTKVDLEEEGKGFEKIETTADIWFWNKDMIKRWSKDKEEFMYYWVECGWKKLWREGDDFYLNGKKIDRKDAYVLTNHPKGTSFAEEEIKFVGTPKFELMLSPQKPSFEFKDEPFEKGGKKFQYQEKGKYFPAFGEISALDFDQEQGKIWFALTPILSSKYEQGGSISEEGAVLYQISKEPPHEGGIIEIDINTNEQKNYNHNNGFPKIKVYKANEEIIETEALRGVTITKIEINSNEIKFYVYDDKPAVIFDKIKKEWHSV